MVSLDTGLRLDGLPALELWDLIVSVLGNVSRVSDRTGQLESDDHKHHKSHNKINVMKDIDSVPSNVQSARQEALLYVFEDNEAVIKMIIEGRSPTMRQTCFQNPQSCSRLIVRSNQSGFQNPNQIHRHHIWIRLPRHKWQKSWSNMEDTVVPRERNLYGHPLAGLLWERQFRENPIEIRLGESFQLGMLIRTP